MNGNWSGAIDAYRKTISPERRQMIEMMRKKNMMGYGNDVAKRVYSEPLDNEGHEMFDTAATEPAMMGKMMPGSFNKTFGTSNKTPPVNGVSVSKESVSLLPLKAGGSGSKLDNFLKKNADSFGKSDDSGDNHTFDLEKIVSGLSDSAKGFIKPAETLGKDILEYLKNHQGETGSNASSEQPWTFTVNPPEPTAIWVGPDKISNVPKTLSENMPQSYLERNPDQKIGLLELLKSLFSAQSEDKPTPDRSYYM